MYRERIETTPAKSEEAKRLKTLMLEYNDHQSQTRPVEIDTMKAALATWQTDRLKMTHSDLYHDENFQNGIDFLLQELYGAKDFSARDRDLERIFPKLIKLLPNKLIHTVSNLVELNLLTQQLDEKLAIAMLELNANPMQIIEQTYVLSYAKGSDFSERQRQLELVSQAGQLLDKHARNPLLRFSLNVSERPANKAGLAALHSFLVRGFDAFYAMTNVNNLMQTLIQRESQILSRIYEQHPTPFQLK